MAEEAGSGELIRWQHCHLVGQYLMTPLPVLICCMQYAVCSNAVVHGVCDVTTLLEGAVD